ncbi:Oidioi.mRNA.OKI2018_I69.chr2.g5419.t1.cds [Oikopleura dioica]|uniref:Oidioi.mRNA.OKI2018_I69.chr2.g5419.t1.cds n=1 Tax=Oikopleura dioica TaxID=34765 RepID=A0ABN7T3X1_OIKDI|nr:Oidioi.mRNA.OKI2018_I69.chr2.g5419.t1.cds [Oikopleura dioica]
MSPIGPGKPATDTSGSDLNSSGSSGGSVIPMDLGATNGTMFETAHDTTAIPEVVASEETVVSHHYDSKNATATAERPIETDSKPEKPSGKRPRVDSPNSSVIEAAPPKRRSAREKKQTSQLNIGSSKGKSYDSA